MSTWVRDEEMLKSQSIYLKLDYVLIDGKFLPWDSVLISSYFFEHCIIELS